MKIVNTKQNVKNYVDRHLISFFNAVSRNVGALQFDLGLPITVHRAGDNSGRIDVCQNGICYVNIYPWYLHFIYDSILVFFSDPDFYKELGESKEIVTVHSFSLPYYDNHYHIENIDISKERFQAAQFIYQLITEFIACHEIAHISLGHLDFIQTNPDNIVKQTLEVDADSEALRVMFSIVRFRLLERQNEIPVFFRSPKKILEALLIAIAIMYILDSNPPKSNLLDATTHPNNYFRFTCLIDCLYKYPLADDLNVFTNITENEIRDLFIETGARVWNTRLRVSPENVGPSIFAEAKYDSEYQEYFDLLKKKYLEIRDQLKSRI